MVKKKQKQKNSQGCSSEGNFFNCFGFSSSGGYFHVPKCLFYHPYSSLCFTNFRSMFASHCEREGFSSHLLFNLHFHLPSLFLYYFSVSPLVIFIILNSILRAPFIVPWRRSSLDPDSIRWPCKCFSPRPPPVWTFVQFCSPDVQWDHRGDEDKDFVLRIFKTLGI